MSTCVRSGMYKEAVFLLAVASVYGRFDTLRVADRTAHQAATFARMQALGAIDKDKQTTLQENIKTVLGQPEGLADMSGDHADRRA